MNWMWYLKYLTVVVGLVSGVVGMTFVIWRKMRIDCPEEDIFTFIGWEFLIMLVGSWASRLLHYPGSLLVLWLMLVWAVVYWKRREWDAWEWGDLVGWMSLVVGLGVGIMGRDLNKIVGFVVGSIIAGFVAKRYRKFGWYKSGKVGLVGLFCLAWWGVVEFVVANSERFGIYSFGFRPQTWLAVGTMLAATAGIYQRSGLQLGQKLWQRMKQKK